MFTQGFHPFMNKFMQIRYLITIYDAQKLIRLQNYPTPLPTLQLSSIYALRFLRKWFTQGNGTPDAGRWTPDRKVSTKSYPETSFQARQK